MTAPKSFIEAQFPVSKVSKESYKERKANYSQTLTGLGKWWGRKPLVLVRSAILGLLLPATDDSQKDREIFLKILTMDQAGLWRRKSKAIPLKVAYERLAPSERREWFGNPRNEEKLSLKKEKKGERDKLQSIIFSRFSYDEKLEYCDRPEQVEGPSKEAWAEINAHLGTTVQTIPELVWQLGQRQFGRVPRIGDAFCGGGSIPFEAARMGCESYGSDLNPVAVLLSWAAVHVIGGGVEITHKVREAQRRVYSAVDRQITDWRIEHNEQGWRADVFLYCIETKCPECNWVVPLAPSWVIGEKTHTVARLVPIPSEKKFLIEILSGVSEEEMKDAKERGTTKDGSLHCPNNDCKPTPITMIRGDRRSAEGSEFGLRMWSNEDLVPRPGDTLGERLYCVRWVETWIDDDGKPQRERHYKAPDESDLERERTVLLLLEEHLKEWQAKGFLPSRRIEPGDETTRLLRERGWTYWHHLFTPRQLLIDGLIAKGSTELAESSEEQAALLLGLGKALDWNSRLCKWTPAPGSEKTEQTFLNQALNTLSNFGVRGLTAIEDNFKIDFAQYDLAGRCEIAPVDVRSIRYTSDLWISDPPYADAINYHELSEFFLAWYDKPLIKLFPDWYTDSKRALAVTGKDQGFRTSMVECYRRLAESMPDNGAQIVMFTHQDASVWSDLALILWASGLSVTSAWCIATETDTALREGNYVQGTVLLILRKQTSQETAFLDDIVPMVEEEVKAQLESMLKLDDQEDPNFGDTDYQLAAYAAALRILTKYRSIEDIDVAYELSKIRKKGEASPIELVIANAVKTACDYLVPRGFDDFVWKTLSPEERFYLKGLDLESHKEFRTSAYMELARGFGVRDYKTLLSSGKANQTRLKTASEFGSKSLGESGFGHSLVRHALFATHEAIRQDAQVGRNWLKAEIPTYWSQRKALIAILRYLSTMSVKIRERWSDDGHGAGLVAGALENDSV